MAEARGDIHGCAIPGFTIANVCRSTHQPGTCTTECDRPPRSAMQMRQIHSNSWRPLATLLLTWVTSSRQIRAEVDCNRPFMIFHILHYGLLPHLQDSVPEGCYKFVPLEWCMCCIHLVDGPQHRFLHDTGVYLIRNQLISSIMRSISCMNARHQLVIRISDASTCNSSTNRSRAVNKPIASMKVLSPSRSIHAWNGSAIKDLESAKSQLASLLVCLLHRFCSGS